ncbi:MAG: hypothetical protein ACRDSR_24630 [Pseudonocardiaceae bacterium]
MTALDHSGSCAVCCARIALPAGDSYLSDIAPWTRLGKPRIEQFGVTADDDVDHQYVWYDHPDSGYRWPLPR